jgi:hypothetical protein
MQMKNIIEISSDYIYNTIAAPVVRELCAFVLLFGVFEVLLRSPYLSGKQADVEALFSLRFFRRILILGAVVLLSAYMAMSYEIHFSHSLKGSIVLVEDGKPGPSDQPWISVRAMKIAKLQMLSLIPIDLLGVIATLVIFVIVTRGTQGKITSSEEIKYLFFMTSIWHMIWVVWWIVYSFSSSQKFPWEDVIFHFSYSAAHMGLFVVAQHVYRKKPNSVLIPRKSHLKVTATDWTFTILYSGLLFSAYAYRMWLYADRLVTGNL